MIKQQLFEYLGEGEAEAIFLMKKANVRWATGFCGKDSYALITADQGFLITDPRYTEQAEKECPGFDVVDWRSGGLPLMAAVAEVLRDKGIRSVAFESDALPYKLYAQLRELTDARLIPTENAVERMRSIKMPQETEYLRAACDIACRAFWRIVKDIRVGVTEKELAARLSAYMVMEGADTQPYGNILISGPNTSLLHGIPSDRALAYGDFVLMDYGCQFHGYMSDMTRTVVVGKASPRQREIYGLEKRMVEDALAEMKAGNKLTDVYKASIKAIENTDWLQYHYPGIGHGIGLFVHELPFISPRSGDEVFMENSVTTIEPGLYIPGWGGVRIEDQVLITEDGCENMITVPHDLMEL